MADDHAVVRRGLALLLDREPDFQVVAEAADGAEAVERHRANILEKLGLRDRVELTRYAIRRGLIEP